MVKCWVMALAAGVVGFIGAQAQAVELAAIDHVSQNVYLIDSDHLGTKTLVGTVTAGTDLYQLTNAGPGKWWVFDRDANTIITISQADAHVLSVVPLDQDAFVTRRGFDVSPAGVLYGVLPGMQLRTINPITGATTFVANITGAARVEAIAFAPDGRLFASGSAGDDANSENLYTLNPTTGALTLLGLTGVSDIDTLAYGNGQLFGADSVDGTAAHLYRLDQTTGVATNLGQTTVPGLNGLVAVAPEPGMVGVGLVAGVVWLGRKRRG